MSADDNYAEARALAERVIAREDSRETYWNRTDARLARALLSALAEIEAKGGSDGWQAEVLSMIFEECKRLDESGYDGSGTPPMSYNDWIRRLVLRARAERDAALREREEARGLLAYVGGRVAADVASEDAVPTREEIDFALLRRSEREEASRDALAGALRTLVDDLHALIEQSEGVAGLHANGDLAEWGEITEGGRFEEWLGPAMSAAQAALDGSTAPSPCERCEKLAEALEFYADQSAYNAHPIGGENAYGCDPGSPPDGWEEPAALVDCGARARAALDAEAAS